MGNNGRIGFFRRHIRNFLHRFQPPTPFTVDLEGKGILTPIANAQDHVWKNYQVTLPTLLNLKHPLHLIVLSDLHIGSHNDDLKRLENIVVEISKREFDILLLPGDFVNMQIFGGGRIKPESIAKILRPLTKRIPTFAVLGNHDSEYGLDQVERSLTAAGVTVLRNSWAKCATSAGDFFIIGLDDESTGFPDFTEASKGLPENAPLLVLAHDPASMLQIPDRSLLMVSGHTHGGQVRLPWFGPVINASSAPLAWSQGHTKLGSRQLIVSAGLGTSVLPFRFRCLPELNEIKLTSPT